MSSPFEDIRTLAVRLHGRRIGVINRLAGDRQLFAFDQDYVDDPNRPTLSLSYKARDGGLVTKPRSYTTRVPPFFSNLLPEGHLRDYLARRAGVKPVREFFLLSVLGPDLPGAVEVVPIPDDERQSDHEDQETHDDDQQHGKDRPVLRFSLAGVQLKFSAILEAAGGLTVPADGMGGAWILKLPSAQYMGVPENEFAMMELARTVGIDVPETRLIPVEEIQGLPSDAGRLTGQALAVRRFDRTDGGGRVHMEDFAQVFGLFPDDKYGTRSADNIASVLRAEVGNEGSFEFVRRLAFSVAIGNADMHLKNWSLLYPDTRTAVLSPAYDLLSTIPYLPEDELALTMGGSRSLSAITKDQVRKFTDKSGLPTGPTWDLVCETQEAVSAAWSDLSARDILLPDIERAIDRQISH